MAYTSKAHERMRKNENHYVCINNNFTTPNEINRKSSWPQEDLAQSQHVNFCLTFLSYLNSIITRVFVQTSEKS